MTKKKYLKIISILLIQAFLAFDLCWAVPLTVEHAPADSTLAPSMLIDELNLQVIFDAANEGDMEELDDLGWGDVTDDENIEETVFTMATQNSSAFPVASGEIGNSSSLDAITEIIEVPPPPEGGFSVFSNAALRNTIGIYPYNKKKLEEEITQYYGFSMITSNTKRKVLAHLLQLFELHNSAFVHNLLKIGVSRIGYKSSIVKKGEGFESTFVIENGTLFVTNMLFTKTLEAKVQLLNSEIQAFTKGQRLLEYIDYDGRIKMASSEDLGLPKKADDMLREMKKLAANYNFPPYWYGIKIFIPYKTDNPGEFMLLMRFKDNPLSIVPNKLKISLKILPKFTELFVSAPKIWQELFLSGLAHEGGKRGHMKLFPLASIEDALKYFDWSRMVRESAELLVQNFTNEKWPDELVINGLPGVKDWLPAGSIINKTLEAHGYSPTNPEPDGILWKEYQANYGMVQERGIRSVAVWLWWLSDFLGLNINLQKEFDTVFSFLTDEQRVQVIQEVGKIKQEYQDALAEKGTQTTTKSTANALAGFDFFSTALLGGAAIEGAQTVIQAGVSGVDVFVMATIAAVFIAGKFFWDKFPYFKSVERRTEILVQRAIKADDPTAFRNYYQNASMTNKTRIIKAAADEIGRNKDKVQPKLLETFYEALNINTASVLEPLSNTVSNHFQSRLRSVKVTPKEMEITLNAIKKQTGIDFHTGNSVSAVTKMTVITNKLRRSNKLDTDSFMQSAYKDKDLYDSFNRLLASEFVNEVHRFQRRTSANAEKSVKVILTDYKEYFNLDFDIDTTTFLTVDHFLDNNGLTKINGQSEITVSLLQNPIFMETVIAPQRDIEVSTLFDALLKQLIVLREVQSKPLDSAIKEAVERLFPGRGLIKNAFPQLPMLVTDLAIKGQLHKEAMFIAEAMKIDELSARLSEEEAKVLWQMIVTVTETADNTSTSWVSSQAYLLASGLDALAATTGININSQEMALEIMVRGWVLTTPRETMDKDAVFQAMVELAPRLKHDESAAAQARTFIDNIDATLINGMALNLAFKSLNGVMRSEVSKFNLNDDEALKVEFALVNAMAQRTVRDGAEAALPAVFQNAVDAQVNAVRFAAAQSLKNFSSVGVGTDEMVAKVDAFLADSALNIREDLLAEKKIREELNQVLKNIAANAAARKESGFAAGQQVQVGDLLYTVSPDYERPGNEGLLAISRKDKEQSQSSYFEKFKTSFRTFTRKDLSLVKVESSI